MRMVLKHAEAVCQALEPVFAAREPLRAAGPQALRLAPKGFVVRYMAGLHLGISDPGAC